MARGRILVVDDDQSVRDMLSDYLQMRGHQVEVAEDGEAALDKLPGAYDLVIADIVMPKLDGVEFLEAVQGIRTDLPVLLITGMPTMNTIVRAKKAGAAGYLRKPLELRAVAEQVEALLKEETKAPDFEKVLVVTSALAERLKEKLLGFSPVVAEAGESLFAIRDLIRREKPKAILVDLDQPETTALVRALRGLGWDLGALIGVAEQEDFARFSELLFSEGADGCLALTAAPREIRETVAAAIEKRDTDRRAEQEEYEQLANQCLFQKVQDQLFYCTNEGFCPDQRDWVFTGEKVQRQKCGRRPLLFDDLGPVGFAVWAGRTTAEKIFEYRRKLLALIKRGKRVLIINCTALKDGMYNLFELLSDILIALKKAQPKGEIYLINLIPDLLAEFGRAKLHPEIHCLGRTTVDSRAKFGGWGG